MLRKCYEMRSTRKSQFMKQRQVAVNEKLGHVVLSLKKTLRRFIGY